jgi:hypothetical protein
MNATDVLNVKEAARQLLGVIEHSGARKSRVPEVRRPIEAFLQKLLACPEVIEELRRRAGTVEGLCGPGSRWSDARSTVIRELKSSQILECGDLAAQLDETPPTPRTLTEIDSISAVLRKANDLCNTSSPASALLDECISIQRQADGLHVDGCWLLVQHLREMQGEPDDCSTTMTALTCSPIGRGNLALIKPAVAVLVELVDKSASPALKAKRARSGPLRKPGRKGPSAEVATAEIATYEAWKKAKENGECRKEFARREGMKPKDLDRLIERVSKREARDACSSSIVRKSMRTRANADFQRLGPANLSDR